MEVQGLVSGNNMDSYVFEVKPELSSADNMYFLLNVCRISGREYLLPVGIILKVQYHSSNLCSFLYAIFFFTL